MRQIQATFYYVRSSLFSAFFVTAVAVGCKSLDPAPTQTSLSGSYKLTGFTRIQGIASQELLWVFGESCTKALIIPFKANNTLPTNAPTDCSTGSFQAAALVTEFTNAKWAVNGSTLSVTPAGDVKTDYTHTVVGNKLTISLKTPLSNGQTVEENLELTKQ